MPHLYAQIVRTRGQNQNSVEDNKTTVILTKKEKTRKKTSVFQFKNTGFYSDLKAH